MEIFVWDNFLVEIFQEEGQFLLLAVVELSGYIHRAEELRYLQAAAGQGGGVQLDEILIGQLFEKL